MSYCERVMSEPGEVAQLSPEERIRQLEEENDKLHRENEGLKLVARKDSLTGVDNRLSFDERMPEAIGGAIRTGEELSALFIDLDNMKGLNDQYGHPAADEVLKAVAVTLRSGLYRSTDSLFRLSGDEFSVLLPVVKKPNAVQVAMRLRQILEELRVKVNGDEIAVTISVGVDSFKPPQDKKSLRKAGSLVEKYANGLIIGANKAMYYAKVKGRNSVGFIFDDDREKFEIGQLFGLHRDVFAPIARNAPHPSSTSIHK